MWFYVTGILKPAVLAPEIDSSVLLGYPAAEKYLHYGGHPTTIYLRAGTSQDDQVDNLLAAQANPENPSVLYGCGLISRGGMRHHEHLGGAGRHQIRRPEREGQSALGDRKGFDPQYGP